MVHVWRPTSHLIIQFPAKLPTISNYKQQHTTDSGNGSESYLYFFVLPAVQMQIYQKNGSFHDDRAMVMIALMGCDEMW